MSTADILTAYVDRSWRFLAELQRFAGTEFVLGRREGSYIWNVEQTKRLLDCGNSGGVHSLGHRNPEVRQALLDALETYDAGLWTMPTQEALDFQDAIAECAPCRSLCRSVLTLSSTDTIDLAVMFAFRVTGRHKVLAYREGYHGHSGFAAMITGSPCEGLLKHYSLPTEFSKFFDKYGDLESILPSIDGDCAAVILEPMNYETFQPAPDGFLEGLAKRCRETGTLLIVDETRTGIGRSGRLWMTSYYDVEPDIMILGKGLGGGYYPVSAMVTTKPVYDRCMNDDAWGFMSSMAGSPIGAIIAKTVIGIARRPQFLDHVAQLETALTRRLDEVCRRFPDFFAPAWVRGGIAAVKLQKAETARSIRYKLFHRGILCHSVSEIAPRVVKFFPCLTSNPQIADEISSALADIAESSGKGN
jgi:putrescine aminotransferase